MRVLKIPYPFKAILSISNDPDNTTIENWEELNNVIFNELNLDWANSIFPINKNLNLFNQVSLDRYPHIANQPTDTIHTWGDFVHSGNYGFTRKDAHHAIQLLNKHRINPKVWVDHSRFLGNLIHGNTVLGGKEFHTDASGIKYKNYEYSVDLIHTLGVRYLWDGNITKIIGQDRPLCLKDFTIKQLLSGRYTRENNLLTPVEFGGYKFYKFKRYGDWRFADILGLSDVLSEKFFSMLIRLGGVSFVYTHLGKRNPKQSNTNHIPDSTLNSLTLMKELIDSNQILFAPISRVLDYVVLRDGIKINENIIEFNSDHIRYKEICLDDLKGHTFSFKNTEYRDIVCKVNNQNFQPLNITKNGSIFSVTF